MTDEKQQPHDAVEAWIQAVAERDNKTAQALRDAFLLQRRVGEVDGRRRGAAEIVRLRAALENTERLRAAAEAERDIMALALEQARAERGRAVARERELEGVLAMRGTVLPS